MQKSSSLSCYSAQVEMELLLFEVMISVSFRKFTLCKLILKPTLCRVTKLVRSVSLCSAKSCLERSEALKGLNMQTADRITMDFSKSFARFQL